MRTSAMQFELLVEYMEKYGDLSKPSEGPRGRILNIKRWDKLTKILNSDAIGDSKAADKWRKVWSDFKNNSKKKAARILKAKRGTRGGPTTNLKLTELEKRALRLLGNKAAAGFEKILETGIKNETRDTPPPNPTNKNNDAQLQAGLYSDWNRAGTSSDPLLLLSTFEPPEEEEDEDIAEATSVAQKAETLHVHKSEPVDQIAGTPPRYNSPTSSSSTELLNGNEHRQHVTQSPTPLPPTARRQRRTRMQDITGEQTRTRIQRQSDLAMQAFVRSDREWRAFKQEAERERIRLRELELTRQDRLFDLLQGFLVVFNRIADNLETR